MSTQLWIGNQQARIEPEDNGLFAVSMPDAGGVWRKITLSASREAAQESAEFYIGWLKVSGGQGNGKFHSR